MNLSPPRLAATLLLGWIALPGLPAKGEIAPANLEVQVDRIAGEAIRSGSTAGVSIGIAKSDEVLLAKGYGFADIEHEVPATADTVYRIGSITKMFTATSILLLQEEGKLDADDLLTDFLPDYPMQGHEVTLRHLLQHTSGIKSFTSIPSYRPLMRNDITHEEIVNRFKDVPFAFAPGEKFAYCNSGYYLLGMIVEEASGEEYEDFLEKRVFEKLGLEETFYDRHWRVIPNRAEGYARGEEGFLNAPYVSMTQPFAAGALASSVNDLIRWQRALVNHELLEAETFKEMTTPGVLNGGKPFTYGYGVFARKMEGHKMIRHGGGIVGFRSELIHYRDSGLTIAVLCNTGNAHPDRIANRIAQIFFEGESKDGD